MAEEPRGERFGRSFYRYAKEAAEGFAGQYGIGYRGKKLTRAEEKLIFMSRVDHDGTPGISDEEALQWLASGKSPEETGLAMFPQRQKLAESNGRIEPRDQIRWTNRTADEIAQQELAMKMATDMEQQP